MVTIGPGAKSRETGIKQVKALIEFPPSPAFFLLSILFFFPDWRLKLCQHVPYFKPVGSSIPPRE